jgi:hypothetical protein
MTWRRWTKVLKWTSMLLIVWFVGELVHGFAFGFSVTDGINLVLVPLLTATSRRLALQSRRHSLAGDPSPTSFVDLAQRLAVSPDPDRTDKSREAARDD